MKAVLQAVLVPAPREMGLLGIELMRACNS